MAKQDFIPKRDNDLKSWHNNFKTAVTTVGATVGLAAEDLTAVAADNAQLIQDFDAADAASVAAKSANSTKRNTRQQVVQKSRALARRIKAHPNYTETIGTQLGIVGPEDTTDLDSSRPSLKAKALPGGAVELSYIKSIASGVNIYARREDEAEFEFLAFDISSPYIDKRPLQVNGKPERREYKAVYVSGNAEVGDISDEVEAICRP